MSFKLPFDLLSIQESLNYENLSKSIQKVNPSKYSDQFKESIQPFASRTTQFINGTNISVSELPVEYLRLEASCDLLLKLYTELIEFNNDTFANVSYDYPPANYTLTKIRDANVGGLISSKFTQLKKVSSPQEFESILMGAKDDKDTSGEDHVEIQTTSVQIPKTFYGYLSHVTEKHGQDFMESSNALSLGLMQVSSTYLEIASARLDMDKTMMNELNAKLVLILNNQFIKVNELRKNVYSIRLDFDTMRATVGEDEENEDLIKCEDEYVSATEIAVTEMKKLLKPSKSVSLLKVFVDTQKLWFETSYKQLTALSESLDKIDIAAEEEEEDDEYQN